MYVNIIYLPNKKQGSAIWQESLAVGNAGERAVAEAMVRLGFRVSPAPFACREYDVRLTADVEIKCDTLAGKTGQIFVELTDSGRASGLTTTSADAWIYVADHDIWIIPTSRLKMLVSTCQRRQFTLACGRVKTGALIPLRIFQNHCHWLGAAQ